jgi:hypothetical protein
MRIVSLKSDELFHKVNLNVLLYMYVKLEYFTRNIDIKSKFESIVVYVVQQTVYCVKEMSLRDFISESCVLLPIRLIV